MKQTTKLSWQDQECRVRINTITHVNIIVLLCRSPCSENVSSTINRTDNADANSSYKWNFPLGRVAEQAEVIDLTVLCPFSDSEKLGVGKKARDQILSPERTDESISTALEVRGTLGHMAALSHLDVASVCCWDPRPMRCKLDQCAF